MLASKTFYFRIFLILLLLKVAGCTNLHTNQEKNISWSNWGEIISLNTKSKSCITIAAPHGTNDEKTDILARDISKLGGFSAIIATGFVEGSGYLRNRINVNRPTEKFKSGSSQMHYFSKRSQSVYNEYLKQVLKVHTEPITDLYIEIHGQAKFPQEIEIATKGITLEDAKFFMQLWGKNKTTTKKTKKIFDNFELRIEPLHSIYYRATDNKDFGMISKVEKALHIELPRVLRTVPEYRKITGQIITKVLLEFKERMCK